MLRASARKILELGSRAESEPFAIRVRVNSVNEPLLIPEGRHTERKANGTVAQTA
jgi:hypothetical protein